MVHIINNILDVAWLFLGGLAILVAIAVFTPWRFVYEVILLTLAVIWVAFVFLLTEGDEGLIKMFRKRHKNTEASDNETEHDLFI